MATAGTALITGASSGIGLAFARRLAADGHPLVLVARDRARLERLAAELPVEAEVLAADLGEDKALDAVADRLQRSDIGVLVNNAGFGTSGALHEIDVAAEEALLRVNVRAVLRLTMAALPGMLERGAGDIVNISSMAGFLPGSGASTYGASKAYVTALSQSLAATYGASGVRTIAVCPGFTHTEFHARAGGGEPGVPSLLWLTPEQVVVTALKDLDAGRDLSIAGLPYKVIRALTRTLPGPVLRRLLSAGRARRGRD